MNGEFLFKSSIGGFRKIDVIDYIDKLQNEFFSYRKNMEESLDSLNRKIDELKDENSQLRTLCEMREIATPEQVAKSNAERTASEIKSVIAGLSNNMNEFFARMLETAQSAGEAIPKAEDGSIPAVGEGVVAPDYAAEEVAKAVKHDEPEISEEKASEKAEEATAENAAEESPSAEAEDEFESINDQIDKILAKH